MECADGIAGSKLQIRTMIARSASAGRASFCVSGSEFVLDASLLHNLVRRMSRQTAPIYGKRSFGYRAVPNFVIAWPLALKKAVVAFQDFDYLAIKTARHLVRAGSL